MFEEAGYDVVVASRTLGPQQAKNADLQVEPNILLEDVRVEDYDAILFNCDNDITFGSARAETDRIAQEAVTREKVLAAICSGPRVLAYADVVEGLQTTGEPSRTCDMLEQSGAACTGAEVERDGLIITARDRYASRAFARTILEAMQEQSVTPPLEGGGDGLIAFVSDRDGNGEIYVMNADGSNQRRLTHFRNFDGVPTWSPDGRQLAFYTYLSHSKWAIQVMDADGSNQRPLTDNDACDGAPFWSPDGAWIVFTSAFDCDPDNREIVVMNADGSNQVKLTDNDVDDYLSAWSPDSQQIAFVSDRDGNDEIYTMNADGSNPQRLTFNDAHDYMPAWSPDGAQIAFASDRDGNDEIYVMDADGGNLQRLTDNDADEWFPSWSPDGAQLLFNSKRDGDDMDVYVMNAGGTNVRRLTDSPGQDFNAVWQPLSLDEQGSRDAVGAWVKTYEGDPRWAALDALVTGDGGYLLVGATNYSHQNTQQEDVYLVKTDAAGEIVWGKAYGGDDFDRGNAVIQANDGGFVILGDTESSGAGDWDMGLLKVDADGNELWSKTFGGPDQERGNAIRRTTDGGYILVGSTKSFGAGGSDLYLVKTDDLGNEVWSQTYGGELDEDGYDVHHTSDGGFFILAQVLQSASLYTDQNPDIFLLRTDGAGNEIWSQVWEEENVEGGHALLPASDGNYIVVGITSSAGSESDIDFLFLKIDAGGNLVWDRSISDANAVDYGIDVIETSDSGYLITGMFSGGGLGAIPLIKTDGSGQVLWTRNLIEGRGNKVGMRVFPASDGGYMIVGGTDEYRRGFETVLIKTDSEGKVNE
jgi:Tol biopolymer transport system component/putative intracellular protease/amidase